MIKVIAGAMGGVFVPIIIEYAAKGADINASVPLKWSGVVGIAMGVVPIAAVASKMGPFRMMKEEDKDAVLAFGAASLATGISILILEQLRKSAGYAFRGRGMANMPPPPQMNGLGTQAYTAPVGQIIKEI